MKLRSLSLLLSFTLTVPSYANPPVLTLVKGQTVAQDNAVVFNYVSEVSSHNERQKGYHKNNRDLVKLEKEINQVISQLTYQQVAIMLRGFAEDKNKSEIHDRIWTLFLKTNAAKILPLQAILVGNQLSTADARNQLLYDYFHLRKLELTDDEIKAIEGTLGEGKGNTSKKVLLQTMAGVLMQLKHDREKFQNESQRRANEEAERLAKIKAAEEEVRAKEKAARDLEVANAQRATEETKRLAAEAQRLVVEATKKAEELKAAAAQAELEKVQTAEREQTERVRLAAQAEADKKAAAEKAAEAERLALEKAKAEEARLAQENKQKELQLAEQAQAKAEQEKKELAERQAREALEAAKAEKLRQQAQKIDDRRKLLRERATQDKAAGTAFADDLAKLLGENPKYEINFAEISSISKMEYKTILKIASAIVKAQYSCDDTKAQKSDVQGDQKLSLKLEHFAGFSEEVADLLVKQIRQGQVVTWDNFRKISGLQMDSDSEAEEDAESVGVESLLKKFAEIPTADPSFTIDGKSQVVHLSSFSIMRTGITQYAYVKVTDNANPSFFKEEEHCPDSFKKSRLPDGSMTKMCKNHPVERVSYIDVLAFINTLNKKSRNFKYRLPTRFEMQHVFSSVPTEEDTWHKGNSQDQTWPVSDSLRQPVGKMWRSSVMEWLQAQTTDKQGERQIWGISWKDNMPNPSVAWLYGKSEVTREEHIGFRLVREPK